MSNRVSYLDIARGIAIFLVVLGHCISWQEFPVNRLILSFHMPLFFIISGMLLNEKTIAKQDVKKWLQKKCKRLLIPQITLGLFECIFIIVKGFLETNTFLMLSVGDVLHAVLRWWFLLVLFQVNIISLLLKNFILKNKMRQIAFLSMLVFVIFLQQKGIFLQTYEPFFINVLPFALMFYMIGFYGKVLVQREKGLNWFYISCAALVCIFVSQINTPVLMYDNKYGNFGMFLITSLLGSFVVISISQKIQTHFFEWLGQVSIIVYVLQFHLNQYSRMIVRYVIERCVINHNLAECMVVGFTTLTSLSFCICLAYFISKTRLKIAFGCEK